MLSQEAAHRKDQTQPSGNKMEHRHFATVAAIIRSMPTVHNGEHGFIDVRQEVAEHFADALTATNTKFDRARFLRACAN